MTKFALRIAPMLFALLALAACGKDQEAAAISKDAAPHETVLATVEMLQNNNVSGLLQASLPPAEYQKLQAKWGQNKETITDEERAKFAQQMEMLTAPDAEQVLFAKLEPFLAQYDTKYKAQIPMYVGMGQTMAATAINQSKDMTSEQKQQAMDVLGALAGWISTTDWSNEAKAKQAIAVVVDTARKLDLGTLDEVRALSFEEAMPKFSTAMAGTKQALAVYGFDINKMLDTVSAETVSENGDQAKVKYSYTLLGQPISGTVNLVRRDGRWFNKEALENFDKAMAQAASSAAPAEAATVAE